MTTLEAGDFFGEVAALRDTPRSATLTAIGSCELLAMEQEAFRSVVAQSLGTVADFDRIVRERLGGDDQ